jgi:oxygen-independent coproporphyrinogen-3 oxidase
MIAVPLSTPYANTPTAGRGEMGLYVHVPFCLQKCPYCSFFSVAGESEMHGNYVQAVTGQIQPVIESGWIEDRQVATIFFGGGTPSILAPELMAGLLKQFHKHFSLITKEVETSIEVNPATVNYSDLAQLHQAGFNRISIGVQSLSDGELLEIGRPHTAADAIQTIADARKAEFSNLNIDLMYG